MGIVYKLDFASGKSYIGATKQTLAARIRRHELAAQKAPERLTFAIHEAWRKFGPPIVTVLIKIDDDHLAAEEMAAIERYQTISPNGYNLTNGGRRTKFAPITRLKRSKAQQGRTFSNETKERMSESQKKRDPRTRQNLGQYWVGKKQSPEHIAKRIRPKGWNHSDETKETISKMNTGRVRSDEVKARIAASVAAVRKRKFWSSKKP